MTGRKVSVQTLNILHQVFYDSLNNLVILTSLIFKFNYIRVVVVDGEDII